MTANDMPLIKLTDRPVNALPHGEGHVDNAPDDKDENEARCVGDPPPLRGAGVLGRCHGWWLSFVPKMWVSGEFRGATVVCKRL